MIGQPVLTTAALVLAATIAAGADDAGPQPSSPYAQWKNGPPKDASYFAIGVATQEPRLAPEYQKAGINLYIDLWEGPTEAQLAELKKCGMQVACNQNAVGLAHKDDPIIVAWEVPDDEPDNAQELPGGQGYGPPISPAKIVEEYEAIRKADPTRPVFLGFGQGVAWDGWVGRGVRTHHPEDYAEYAKGGDIIGYDIYPVAHDNPQVKGKLDMVALGVERLVKWTGGRKPVWDTIECTRIQSDSKATPKQVRAEVWMSLVHGSLGIMYFVHEWKPKFNEHALLDDPRDARRGDGDQQAGPGTRARPEQPDRQGRAQGGIVEQGVPVATMVKRQGGATYVFAVAMKPGATEAAFTLDGLPAGAQVEVLGENRKIEPADGKFKDHFGEWDVHLYRIR